MNSKLSQCCYLDKNGKRCRKRSALKLQVHLDGEMYYSFIYATWVEVNLCVEHYVGYGGTFTKKGVKK